jgi:hypothetical protein
LRGALIVRLTADAQDVCRPSQYSSAGNVGGQLLEELRLGHQHRPMKEKISNHSGQDCVTTAPVCRRRPDDVAFLAESDDVGQPHGAG